MNNFFEKSSSLIKKISAIIFLLITLASCATSTRRPDVNPNEDVLDQAEANATSGGKKILIVSRGMISSQEVVIGGCWDYINKVYERAGFSSNQIDTVFKSKFHGPYFAIESVQAGDWLYFVNHSYRDTEHSAIFVMWTNIEKKEALMVSYNGENRKKPANYKIFLLNNIYNVFRPFNNGVVYSP
ncbi:MAG: hypothetical protein H7336_13375 [Bacteriovorax sp.]|nr:hypothetical protein [Bacteriovorax sp.]